MCDSCETKDEEIRQLKDELYAKNYQAPEELNLRGSQERLLGTLLRRDRIVSRQTLFDATRGLPGTSSVELRDKLIETMICKLRLKLEPHGLAIETVYGLGYRLTPDTRQKLLTWTPRTNRAA